jgi:glycosyltransferase involved in cell wall biosynthesis
MENLKYILITAAKNEEKYIESTIKCVINQTLKPFLWIIVSDNSTDGTDSIIKTYADKFDYITFFRRDEKTERDFASKVFALNFALSKIENIYFDFIGILDADITFNDDYYEKILEEFSKDLNLGLAGGEFFDIVNGKKIRVIKSPISVRGGIQLFRKECFDQLGKFIPIKNGGEDVVMEVMVRRKGWKTKSFDHLILEHHRLTGTGGRSLLESKFREGILSYDMGYHPLFQLLKSVYRIKERPYIISSLLHLLGFIYGNIKRAKRPVPNDFVEYFRKEQLKRIIKFKK